MALNEESGQRCIITRGERKHSFEMLAVTFHLKYLPSPKRSTAYLLGRSDPPVRPLARDGIRLTVFDWCKPR